ncbi:hypothetical protein BGP_1716 [Beggiatoa sp. PS]|nr:hypothetical protein BGP_1716 [Beggiatoa sp. PS]
MYIPGIIKGKQIELAYQTGIPHGMNIIVNIQPIMPTYQEQLKLVDQLCGSWQNDPSISKIFTELDEQRHRSLPRDISFD